MWLGSCAGASTHLQKSVMPSQHCPAPCPSLHRTPRASWRCGRRPRLLLRMARAEAQHYKANLEVRQPLLGVAQGLRACVWSKHSAVSRALLCHANALISCAALIVARRLPQLPPPHAEPSCTSPQHRRRSATQRHGWRRWRSSRRGWRSATARLPCSPPPCWGWTMPTSERAPTLPHASGLRAARCPHAAAWMPTGICKRCL